MNGVIAGSEYFAAIIDSIADYIRVLDLDGKIVLINNSMKSRFGEIVGSQCFECLGKHERCDSCVTQRILRGELSVNAERTVEGRRYSVKATPVINEAGEVLGVVEVFRDITDMADLRDRLITANTKMIKDLHMAKDLQRSMLEKRVPDIPGYNFSMEFYPCDEVGGDVYDCIDLGDGRVLLYVADVSGHGVRAAMITVFFKQIIQTLTRIKGIDIASILKGVEKAFEEFNADISVYITAFLVMLDANTGKYACVNAGHTAVPIIKNGEDVSEIYLTGLPISRWANSTNRDIFEGEIRPGGRLLLFTDGLLDCDNMSESEKLIKDEFCKEPFLAEDFMDTMKGINRRTDDDILMLICERAL